MSQSTSYTPTYDTYPLLPLSPSDLMNLTLNLVRTALIPAALVALAACTMTACGPPDLCKQEGSGSFSAFRSSDWTPYCADLEDRLQRPMNYELILLTEFFSEYPDRASSMKSKLIKFEEYDKCFVSKEDKLAYRRLNSCLADKEVESRIHRAWSVRAKPWLNDYQQRVLKLSEDLDAAERDAEYITTKINQQERKSLRVKVDRVAEFGVQLDELQKELSLIDRAKDDYERLKGASMSYSSLSGHIANTLSNDIAAMFERHDANRFAIARLRNTQRFQEFALKSVGTPCEEGMRARKEQRTAKKLLEQNMSELGSGKVVAISSKAKESRDETSGETVETFEGYVCGKRNIDNQFDGKFQLCSKHDFVITRTKAADARRFGDWTLESIAEGDVTRGVDCNLLDGSPKKR